MGKKNSRGNRVRGSDLHAVELLDNATAYQAPPMVQSQKTEEPKVSTSEAPRSYSRAASTSEMVRQIGASIHGEEVYGDVFTTEQPQKLTFPEAMVDTLAVSPPPSSPSSPSSESGSDKSTSPTDGIKEGRRRSNQGTKPVKSKIGNRRTAHTSSSKGSAWKKD